jgi:ABC-type transporter Mla subunit MlaD
MEEKVKRLPILEEDLAKAKKAENKYRSKFEAVEGRLQETSKETGDRIVQYREELETASAQLTRQSNIISDLRKSLQTVTAELKLSASDKTSAEQELHRL